MTKTRLFTKMVVAYLCIIVSTLTMLGVLLSFLVNNFLVTHKQTELLVKAADIAELVKPYLVEKRDPWDLIDLLNRADKNLGTEIWVIDSKGLVIAASFDQKSHEGDQVDPADIEAMRQGQASIRQGKSSLYKETVLWVTVPIQTEGRVIGGVILYSPIIGITHVLTNIKYLFIYSASVSIIFSTIVVYFLSKYVTGPLREMGAIAKLMALGNYSERVSIRRDDEVGELAQSFNHMAEQIEKQEKMRRDFVADVSHELRSPLNNIQGFIEALMDGKDKNPGDRERYLGIIHKETLRLGRLVNELLDLSRLEAGHPVEKQPLDIVEVIKASTLKMKPVLQEKDINLVFTPPEKPVIVLGLRDRLEQVMTNLLDNAVRYSHQGGSIEIRVREEAGKAHISVIDTGEGIPAEELPWIWERFYKVDKSRSRETGGTGLGLAIVKKIVESFGGRVWAESEPGRRTEIGFTLPLYDSESGK